MQIEHRSILKIAILTLVTFGLYSLIWFFITRDEMKSLGAKIPSAWLMFIPFANLYFYYKYSEAFSQYVKKDGLHLIYFLFLILPYLFVNLYGQCPTTIITNYFILNIFAKTFGFVFTLSLTFISMIIVQSGLNELVEIND